jgi:hypothetical protein
LPADGRTVRLVIAGEARDGLDDVVERARTSDRIAVQSGYIPDAQVQMLYRAADLAVLPYHEYLNSGVMMVALSFDVPVLAARTAVAEDMTMSGLVRLFERGSLPSLTTELARMRGGDMPAGGVATAFAARHDARMLAERFASAVAVMAGE